MIVLIAIPTDLSSSEAQRVRRQSFARGKYFFFGIRRKLMNTLARVTFGVVLTFTIGLPFGCAVVAAGKANTPVDKEKLGKLLIKAAPVGEDGFADPKLEESVKDLKKNHRDFIIVDNEDEADFLIVVVERKNELRSPAGSVVNNKTVRATLSIKDNGKWKPAIKLEHGGGNFWELAAARVMEDAEKWIKKNIKKTQE